MDEIMRLAKLQDVDDVTGLTKRAYAKWVPVIGREPLPMKVDYSAAIIRDRIDILCIRSEIAALVETIQRDDDILIENVAVDPRFQKRGYGRKMVAHAEQLAIQAGLSSIRLYTNSKFETNLRFYESLGYAVEREEALNGGIAIHMLKTLQ